MGLEIIREFFTSPGSVDAGVALVYTCAALIAFVCLVVVVVGVVSWVLK